MFFVSFLTRALLLKKTLRNTFITVYNGIAKIIPTIPNKIPPDNITKKISKGRDLMEFENIYG